MPRCLWRSRQARNVSLQRRQNSKMKPRKRREEYLHGVLKLALIERLDLANGVHGGAWREEVGGKRSWEGPTRSICGTVNSPIVYSNPPLSEKPPAPTCVTSPGTNLPSSFLCLLRSRRQIWYPRSWSSDVYLHSSPRSPDRVRLASPPLRPESNPAYLTRCPLWDTDISYDLRCLEWCMPPSAWWE